LWRKVYINDEAFFAELCNKYFEQIYNYCKKLVKNQEQFMDIVEECAQDAFVEARKQISKLMDHPNIEGWLYVTARNLINNSYRSMYIKKRHEVLFDDNISRTLITDNDFERIFDGSIDVDKLSREILKKLTENEYELYTDYYKSHMSIVQLSQKHDVSATAITTRIYRLKKKIRKLVHDHFEETDD